MGGTGSSPKRLRDPTPPFKFAVCYPRAPTAARYARPAAWRPGLKAGRRRPAAGLWTTGITVHDVDPNNPDRT